MKTFSEFLNEKKEVNEAGMMSRIEKMMPKEVKKQDDDFQYAWMRGAMASMNGKISSHQMDKDFADMLKEVDKKEKSVLINAWKAGYEYMMSNKG